MGQNDRYRRQVGHRAFSKQLVKAAVNHTSDDGADGPFAI
jgi:hypothetical protein